MHLFYLAGMMMLSQLDQVTNINSFIYISKNPITIKFDMMAGQHVPLLPCR